MTEQQTCRSGLQLAFVNVNGLGDQGKRHQLFQALQRSPYDLLLVAETKCGSDAQAIEWIQQGAGPGLPWTGGAHWNHGTSHARGVAIFTRAGLVMDDLQTDFQDAEGRLLRISWKDAFKNKWAAVVVYAPVETGTQRPDFFSLEGPLCQALTAGDPAARVLVAGDFNCVEDLQADAVLQEGQQSTTRDKGAPELADLMDQAALKDAWRCKHPGGRAYTKMTRNGAGTTLGRTSRWYMPTEMCEGEWIHAADIDSGVIPGDHSSVSVRIVSPTAPQQGSGHWVLPHYMFSEPRFTETILDVIAAAKADAEAAQLSAADRWDLAKLKIKAFSMQLSYDLKREKTATTRRLQATVRRLQKRLAQQHDEPTCVLLAAAEHALQQLDAEAAAQRTAAAAALWEHYGEQSTFFFHRLGLDPQDAIPWTAVKDPATGQQVSLSSTAGRMQAGDILADYYDGAVATGLFATPATDAAAATTLLNSIDKQLTQPQQQRCLGPDTDAAITELELEQAVKEAPRGKRAGSDGLPYEFYQYFWEDIKELVLAAFNEPFQSASADPTLSESQRQGLLYLIHKGHGKPRDTPDSYRPITLLNCDYKLVAKVMTHRFGGPADAVLDGTQTAFVPGRWIGDNVMFHMEEIDYLEATNQSGCILFLDFEKAYDRMSRSWIVACMERMSFPAQAIRWVQLLLKGTTGRVMFNGFFSRQFTVDSGVAQGSPLSPLLYAIAAQPLAAHLRQLQQTGQIDAIKLPDGSFVPPSQQHADDTSIHTATKQGGAAALDLAVEPFCQATGSRLNRPKSIGMALGSHPAVPDGLDQETGVEFATTALHLGIDLTTGDRQQAARKMYERRLKGLRCRVHHWQHLHLTHLGRVHVAKQVLANTLAYHFTFVKPPEDVIRLIKRIIYWYVSKGRSVDNPDRPVTGRPAQQTASLPREMGGIAQADIEAHMEALQGKIAAAILHPRRVQWKQLMQAAIQRAVPQMGLRAVVRIPEDPSSAHHHLSRLTPRHRGYISGMQRAGLIRGVPHRDMTALQIGCEGLLGNHSIVNGQGEGFKQANHLPVVLRTAATVRQAIQVCNSQPSTSTGVSTALLLLQSIIHPDWRDKVKQAATAAAPLQADWKVSPAGAHVQHVPSQTLYEVTWDGRLGDYTGGPMDVTTWNPACVVMCPVLKGRPALVTVPTAAAAAAAAAGPAAAPALDGADSQQGGNTVPPGLEPYLLGPWSEVQVDPSVWAFGNMMPVLQYVVKEATQRILQWQVHNCDRWVPGVGMQPAIWGVTVGNMNTADPGAVHNMAQQEQQRHDNARRYRRQRGNGPKRKWTDADLMETTHAPWMDSGPPRAPVRRRLLDNRAVADVWRLQQQQPQQQQQHLNEPKRDDSADRLLPVHPAEVGHAWAPVWKRVHHKRLPRELKYFGWLLLHAAVPVGGSWFLPDRPDPDQLEAQLCYHPECEGAPPPPAANSRVRQRQPNDLQNSPLETLEHMFLQCPASTSVLKWLCGLWGHIDPNNAPPCTAAVLLADDQSTWRPTAAAAASLWTYLRLTVLRQVWVQRCYGKYQQRAVSPLTTVAAAVRSIAADMKADWIRVVSDIKAASGLCVSWFRGRDPMLTPGAFEQRWCHGGVLAAVKTHAGGKTYLEVKLAVNSVPQWQA